MGLGLDNGRRVLLFERHCWALKDLNDKAKLAFFNAMLDYGAEGLKDFGDGFGIVRTLMPEIIALSETSWHRACNRRNKCKTKSEHARNKHGTNTEQNAYKEEEEEKESKDSSTVRVTAHRPTVENVIDVAVTFNWLQDCPGWTVDDLKAAVAEAFSELEAAGWQDANGKPVKNWRLYLRKAVSEKKIKSARAAVNAVPVFREEMLYG